MNTKSSFSKVDNSKKYSIVNAIMSEAKEKAGEYFRDCENKNEKEKQTKQFFENEANFRNYASSAVTQSNIETVLEHVSPGIPKNEKARMINSMKRQDPLVALEHLIALNEECNRGNFAALTGREFFDSMQERDLYVAAAYLSVVGWRGKSALMDQRLRSERMWAFYSHIGAGGTSNLLAGIDTAADVAALIDDKLVQNRDLRSMLKDPKFASAVSKFVTKMPDEKGRLLACLGNLKERCVEDASEIIFRAWMSGSTEPLSRDAIRQYVSGTTFVLKGAARADNAGGAVLVVQLGDDPHTLGPMTIAHDLNHAGVRAIYLSNPLNYHVIADAAEYYGVNTIAFSLPGDSHQRIVADTLNYMRERGHGDTLFIGGGAITVNASSNLQRSGVKVLAQSGDVVDFVRLSGLRNPQPMARTMVGEVPIQVTYGRILAGQNAGIRASVSVGLGSASATAPMMIGDYVWINHGTAPALKEGIGARTYGAFETKVTSREIVSVEAIGIGNKGPASHFITYYDAPYDSPSGNRKSRTVAELGTGARSHRMAYDVHYGAQAVDFQSRAVAFHSMIPTTRTSEARILTRFLNAAALDGGRTELRAGSAAVRTAQSGFAIGNRAAARLRSEYPPMMQYAVNNFALASGYAEAARPAMPERVMNYALGARLEFGGKDGKGPRYLSGRSLSQKDSEEERKRKAGSLPSGATSRDAVDLGPAEERGAGSRTGGEKKGRGFFLFDLIEGLIIGISGGIESLRNGQNERRIRNLLLKTGNFEGALREEAERFGLRLQRNPDGSYYDVLGVNYGSDRAQIRNAYFGLVKRYHPDVSKEIDSEKIIKRINEAYATLGDADLRHAYDRRLGSGSADNDAESARRITQELLRQYLMARDADFRKFEKRVSVPLDRDAAIAAVKDVCDWQWRFEKARSLALGKLVKYGKSMKKLYAVNDRLLRSKRNAQYSGKLEDNKKTIDELLKEYARIERIMDEVTRKVKGEVKAQEEQVAERIWSSIPY
jgi:curved DNA-binding protein CbpA/methylmalonyl-CoA mutase cobalamin-binding subunit